MFQFKKTENSKTKSRGDLLKVRYIAHLDDIDLTEGAVYKVLSVEKKLVPYSWRFRWRLFIPAWLIRNHRGVIMLVNI